MSALPVTRLQRRQHLRLRMLAITGGSYALDGSVLLLYALVGATTFAVPALYVTAGAAVTALFLLVFQSGIGLQSDDPFLTVWQVLAGLAIQFALLLVAPEVAGVFIAIVFLVLGFGALRLTPRSAIVLIGVAAAGVGLAMPFLSGDSIVPLRTAAERWITWLCIVLVVARCVALGLLGSKYRMVLYDRTAALEQLKTTLEDRVAEQTRELARANQELERLVAERTAQIRTLHGVLPICAHCKKIRDERGAWNQLERYITDHADVMFSHGICAECFDVHYADDDTS